MPSPSAKALELTTHQQAELRFRTRAHILSAGGRGSGKSRNLVHALLAHCEDFGAEARPVVFREERNALLQLMATAYELAFRVFGDCARNLNDGTLTLPNGAVVLFSNISDETSYARLQGMTFTAIFGDEVGNYHPNAYTFLMRVRSNLRVSPGRRAALHFTANPHGRSHTILFRNFISKAPAWHPFDDEHGDTWVWTHSTLDSNPFIDRDAYRRQLMASTGSDTALAEAWVQGAWGVLGGNMFDVFDARVHVRRAPLCKYRYRLGGDFGTASPSVFVLLGQVPADVPGFAPGSIIVLDETHTCENLNDPSTGNGAPPQMLAEMVKELLARNGVRYADGALDDMRGLGAETVLGIMAQNGVHLHKPYKKDRVGGWVRIRQMLANAKSGERPGLYFTNKCQYVLTTLPEAPRGTLRPEDIDPKWPKDHGLDALSYGLADFSQGTVGWGRAVGMF